MSDEAQFMAVAEALAALRPDLTMLGTGLIAAHGLGIARDSRSFASKLGVAHALVLRECAGLAEDQGLIAISRTDQNQRVFFELEPDAEALLAQVLQLLGE